MSDHKEYFTRPEELGNIHISEEVLASIAAASALEVTGVSGLTAKLGGDFSELLGKKSFAKGIRVTVEDETVTLDIGIMMAYGYTIPEIGKAVQEGVRVAVESMSGLTVTAVNVNVGGITFPPKAQ